MLFGRNKRVLCELFHFESLKPGWPSWDLLSCSHITVSSGMRSHFGVRVSLPLALVSCSLSVGADSGFSLSLNLLVGHAVTADLASSRTTGSFTSLSMPLVVRRRAVEEHVPVKCCFPMRCRSATFSPAPFSPLNN